MQAHYELYYINFSIRGNLNVIVHISQKPIDHYKRIFLEDSKNIFFCEGSNSTIKLCQEVLL